MKYYNKQAKIDYVLQKCKLKLGKFFIPKERKIQIIAIIIIAITVLCFFSTNNITREKHPSSRADEASSTVKGTTGSLKQSGSIVEQSTDNEDVSIDEDEITQEEEQSLSVAELLVLLLEQGQSLSTAELLALLQQQGQSISAAELLALLQLGHSIPTAELLALLQQRLSISEDELLTLIKLGQSLSAAELLALLQQGQSISAAELLVLLEQGHPNSVAEWLALLQQNETDLALFQAGQGARRTDQPPPVQRIISANMILIKGGSFEMEIFLDEDEKNSSENVESHHVTVSTFYIAKHEVTQREYQNVIGKNPSYFKGPDLPVENVSWFDAIEYCNVLSRREGLTLAYTIRGSGSNRVVIWNKNANGYRLPTEEEWEYACRANTTTPYNTGETITRDMSNYFGKRTVNVGSYAPNDWGLYDMHGNVSEWCWNLFTSPYSDNNNMRIVRGGNWLNTSLRVRSSSRDHYFPQLYALTIGFRVAQNYLDF